MHKINVVHPYPCAPSELLPFFQDSQLLEAKYQALGAEKIRIINAANGEVDSTVKTQREVESDIPAKLKSLLGSRNTIVQTEQWQQQGEQQFHCGMTIKLEGVPITIEGEMTLVEVDGGCENQINLTLKCALPFIGKKLEQFVSESSEQLIEDEYRYLHAQFAEMLIDEH